MNKVNSTWSALKDHSHALDKKTLSELFNNEQNRFQKYSIYLEELLVDFSKNLLTDDTIHLLTELAVESGLIEKRNDMFSGKIMNVSENRPALHTALRASKEQPVHLKGVNIFDKVQATLSKMTSFADDVRSGKCAGVTGKPFKNILHIGVGGSVIGPSMVIRALSPYGHKRITTHFVSNVDSSDLQEKISKLDPETTLILVASKTFLTQETMVNARSAKKWVIKNLGQAAVAQHFVSLSSNSEQTRLFGITIERSFDLWDWVGGRYSLWSAIGLPILIAIGPDRFKQLLDGARIVDEHFYNSPLERNIPVILGLIGVWHRSILGYNSHAIIPYDQKLDQLTAHIQQIDMESNGKSVGFDGLGIKTATAGVLWGETGTNAQHSFFQLLHQGSDIVPCDFLIAATSHDELPDHQETLIANCLAQSQALMQGRNIKETKNQLRKNGLSQSEIEKIAPHATFVGNRPSTTLIYRMLDPKTLGMLISIYEHKAFVQGIIWNINSFDQWGVELGKELANKLIPTLKGGKKPEDIDASTSGLIDRVQYLREDKC